MVVLFNALESSAGLPSGNEGPALVAGHDVCLGIFGTGVKAQLVVPNKVYQGAAAGCAVVTSDTAPQRRALGENAVEHEILVWIADPEAGVGNVRSDVLNRLWRLFKEHGIVVPAPRREIQLHARDAAGVAAAQQ